MIMLFRNEVTKNGLYLRIKDRYCKYKNIEIDLSPKLFETLIILAKTPQRFQRIDKASTKEFMTEKEKTDVKRINARFRQLGLTNKPIIISKSLVGYKLNPNVFNTNLIEIED